MAKPIRYCLASFALIQLGVMAQATGAPLFALERGTYWVYEAYSTLAEEDHTTSYNWVNWRVEVLDTLERDGARVALLSGFPTRPPWAQGEGDSNSPRPPHALIVRKKDGTYLADTKRADELFKRFKEDRAWKPLLDEVGGSEDLWLRDPLPKLGESEDATDEGAGGRRDGWYAWTCTVEGRTRLPRVEGLTPRKAWPFRTVTFFECADDTQVVLVPGLGIVQYDFSHHGTTMEVHIRLVEFGHTDTSGAPPSRQESAKDASKINEAKD